MKYIGFDLGDGESCVAYLTRENAIEPRILSVSGSMSFVSAVADYQGETLVGPMALSTEGAENVAVRFKSRVRTSPDEAFGDVRRFLEGVTLQLKNATELEPLSECKTTVGCPAGWNDALRERYRTLCEAAGLPNVTLTSESRAAFLYARNARGIAAGEDFLSGSTLVIDIGSSTLDFAYVVDGREHGVGTFGENFLGGGVLDECILRQAVASLPAREREKVEDVFRRSPTWRSHALYAARRVKEAYFSDEKKYEQEPCVGRVRLYYDGRQEIIFRLTQEEISRICRQPAPELQNRSFLANLQDALNRARQQTAENPPRVLVLTGGASRMAFFREACQEAFPDAKLICCPEPEFSIARGLAYAGRTDELLEAFRAEIHEYTESDSVERAARESMPLLLQKLSALLTKLMTEEVVAPAAEAWRSGELATLEDMRRRIKAESQALVRREETQKQISAAVAEWLAGVQEKLQRDVDKICIRCQIPCEMMRLPPPELRPESAVAAGSRFDFDAVTTVEAIIGAAVAAVMAALCGGAGLALVAEGPLGMAAGAAIGIVAALLGKPAVESLLMRVNLPTLMRKMLPKNALLSPRSRGKMEKAMTASLEKDEAFAASIVKDVAEELDAFIERLAAKTEIRLN